MKREAFGNWLKHALRLGREFLTHWAAAGLIIALTGLAPEHWLADFFHRLAIPESFWRGWIGGADVRTALVAVGVAIVGWDVARRARRDRAAAAPHTPTSAHVVATPERDQVSALALPDKPSIAVLPFQNMSGKDTEEYFSDGITEDIITELSRFSQLFVIARNSSFQYKGGAIDLRQVGRELGVRHILEGSVRRSGD